MPSLTVGPDCGAAAIGMPVASWAASGMWAPASLAGSGLGAASAEARNRSRTQRAPSAIEASNSETDRPAVRVTPISSQASMATTVPALPIAFTSSDSSPPPMYPPPCPALAKSAPSGNVGAPAIACMLTSAAR